MVLKDSLQAVRMKFDFALRPLRAFASFPHPVCVSFQPLSSSALPPNLTSTLKYWLIKCSCAPGQTISTAATNFFWPSVCVEYSEKRTLKFFFSLHTLILEGNSCSTKWECRKKKSRNTQSTIKALSEVGVPFSIINIHNMSLYQSNIHNMSLYQSY